MISRGKKQEVVSYLVSWNGRITMRGLKAKAGIKRDFSIEEILVEHGKHLKFADTKQENNELLKFKEAVYNFKEFNK
jgi:hypothetical protein